MGPTEGDRAEAGDTAPESVLGRGSIYTIGTAAQLASGLLAIPLLTRLLDPSQYGEVTAGLVVQAVLVNLAALGMPASISRTFFRRPGPGGARALIAATAAGSLVVSAIAYATGPLWSGVFEDIEWGPVLQLAVVAVIPSAILICSQTLLQAEHRPGAFLLTAAAGTIGAQGLGVALAAISGDAAAYMGGLAAGFAIAAVIAWVAAGIQFDRLHPRAGGRSLLRDALAIGLPTIPHGLALYLLSAGDRVVVERLEGLPAAGAYYVAYAIGSLGVFLVAGLNGAWTPMIFGSGRETRWRFLADSAVDVLRVAAPVIAAIAVGAPCALAVFAPSDYDLAGLGTVSALVALASLGYLGYVTQANVIVWRGRTAVLAVATPLAAALNIALCFLLIPPMGLDGAALATLIAYAFLAWITWLRARRLASVPWNPTALASAAVTAPLGLALALALPDDDLWLAVRAVIATAFAALALARLTEHRRVAPAAGA
jgi:O-antigen/teichoic acid export membrane protein